MFCEEKGYITKKTADRYLDNCRDYNDKENPNYFEYKNDVVCSFLDIFGIYEDIFLELSNEIEKEYREAFKKLEREV